MKSNAADSFMMIVVLLNEEGNRFDVQCRRGMKLWAHEGLACSLRHSRTTT